MATRIEMIAETVCAETNGDVHTGQTAGGSRATVDDLTLWFDTLGLEDPVARDSLLIRALRWRYNGVILYPENWLALSVVLSTRVTRVLHVDNPQQWDALAETATLKTGNIQVISSSNAGVLTRAREAGFRTCLRAAVYDPQSLHAAIQDGTKHEFLVVSFQDPTNIPLELIIASLQPTCTSLIKEIRNPRDVDDAVVSLGVMEVGAEGVLFTPETHSSLSRFISRIDAAEAAAIAMETGVITRNVPLGLGTRSCIDVTTLFSEREGLLVGSTSQGGILCCPEVFHLPYMEKRPFRINAGAVHSYVYNLGDRTDYISELRAGSSVMIVDKTGKTRKSYVGRVKTEVRPLRLVEAEFAGQRKVNLILQDDWHVRIFSEDALPLNVTELKPGDRILGHATAPGRHVGIRVEEQILET